jgi:hypothetical protein
VCRRLAREPLVGEVLADARWDRPLQLLGALHYLALSDGLDPWRDPRPVLAERREWLRRFVAEHAVQTNEVQRSWMLLPCFLEAARRTGVEAFDLIELGPSAGLNLVWDGYRYRYAAGDWGDADSPLTLAGEERRGVPPALLALRPSVRRRVGIDIDPIDVTTDEGALLLKAFVWADQRERLERLDRAVEALRRHPPELVRGDFVDLLPAELERRSPDALTVVFQTATLGYVPAQRRQAVYAALDAAGAAGPLAFVSTGQPADRSDRHYGLSVTVWPGGDRTIVAHAGFHGQWLEWL